MRSQAAYSAADRVLAFASSVPHKKDRSADPVFRLDAAQRWAISQVRRARTINRCQRDDVARRS
jgi:hypothetical protein